MVDYCMLKKHCLQIIYNQLRDFSRAKSSNNYNNIYARCTEN